jgi:HK97 family phage prohead protease
MEKSLKIHDLQQIKAGTDGNGTISGYFSVFGNIDRANEIVVKGAFNDTINEFLKSGYIAVNHDWGAVPVAIPLQAYEDEIGLFVTAEFHGTAKAQEIRQTVQERIAKGKDVKCSIGYQVKDADYNTEGVRLLKSVELFECSIVNTPANPRAALTGVKSLLANEMTLDEQHEMALAVIQAFTGRIKGLEELKKKDGRSISKRNKERITSVIEALDGLDVPKSVLRELLAEKDEVQAALESQQAQREETLKSTQEALNKLRAAQMLAHTIIS